MMWVTYGGFITFILIIVASLHISNSMYDVRFFFGGTKVTVPTNAAEPHSVREQAYINA